MRFFRLLEAYLNFAITRSTSIKVQPFTTDTNSLENDSKSSNSVQLHPFTVGNFIPISCLIVGFLSTAIFLFHGAETFQEYSESLYPVVTTLLNIGNLTVLMSNRKQIFKLIDEFGFVVSDRKPISIFMS